MRPTLPVFLMLSWLSLSALAQPVPTVVEWERGVALHPPGQPGMAMYLWFYEWNMFEAMAPGEHTHGTYQTKRRVNAAGTEAEIEGDGIRLAVRALAGGAALTLQVVNRTSHDWPEIAAVIPCWSPGQVQGTDPSNPLPRNKNFADAGRNKSYFLAGEGLTVLDSRSIHFRHELRERVDAAAHAGQFAFSPKWPTSAVDARAGVLIRESEDVAWVTGVGWEDYLSVQGHNPWSCLHAAVRVGPLRRGEQKTVRGRLYLFRGTREECLARFRRDLDGGR